MWKLEYSAPVGLREKKNLNAWVVVYNLNDEQDSLWWFSAAGKFLPYTNENTKKYGHESISTAGKRINSVRAFKRFLRKNPELKGYDVVLASRYYINTPMGKIDLDVSATWEDVSRKMHVIK